jgi:hypothetical protein
MAQPPALRRRSGRICWYASEALPDVAQVRHRVAADLLAACRDVVAHMHSSIDQLDEPAITVPAIGRCVDYRTGNRLGARPVLDE